MFSARRGIGAGDGALTMTLLVVFALAVTSLVLPDRAVAAEGPAPNSANRMIFWSDCGEIVSMSDAELDQWAARGVTAFSCNSQRLPGLGGSAVFTDDLAAVHGKQYGLQRALVDSRIAERGAKRGIDLYLGFYLASLDNVRTPLAEWFDDRRWTKIVLPQVRDLAHAAHALGFAGIALDQELYPQRNNQQTATWDWNYPGNTRSEQEVRAQVRARGAELMQAILQGFPDVEILAYASQFPDTWEEVVQEEVNGSANALDNSVNLDFWDGLTSIDGYGSIRFLNAIFYKTTHVGDASWDDAFAYEYNSLFALLSCRLSNWSYAADRISESPFVWISAGPSRFEAARSPDEVGEQVAAARRWGMGRAFANYTSDSLRTFDYGPYLDALRAATRRGVVDREPPRLGAVDVEHRNRGLVVSGTASDDYAVRFVHWQVSDGHTGVARMTWTGGSDSGDGSRGQMQWRATLPPDTVPASITITVEDIHGLTATQIVAAAD